MHRFLVGGHWILEPNVLVRLGFPTHVHCIIVSYTSSSGCKL